MKDFTNTDQRQMSLFPENSGIPSKTPETSTVVSAPQQTAQVLSFFDAKKDKRADAEAKATERVLQLLAL